MRVNADFGQLAFVTASDADWRASPEPGVERRMLDRVGDEVARATSIVRYAPGSSFARHAHSKGEEFLVLDGVFSDESGDYPTGTYVRNPPGSSHAPSSSGGCRILVKLRQFDAADLRHCVIDTRDESLWSGRDELPLHAYGAERVAMRRLGAGDHYALDANAGGTEILVVDGVAVFEGEQYPAESWLRFPPAHEASIVAGAPTRLWIKTGHLEDIALAQDAILQECAVAAGD
ncbi:MAG: cupin domain-containing protein [Gammaproteobacteria bacterium]|nr:cupin domain-containing protein [Gammaproteobacteria bacterium]MDH4255050.1 cupin domain-containing protein [Gammaproteobacteria bacterium]MDH5310950.1 cupin domain-containing protein [Gammaproteobacteria bacterium]